MSNETPKLYVHKPKKARLKKHVQQQSHPSPSPSPSPSPVSSSTAPAMASQSTTVTSSSSRIPTPPPKESFARRYRFLWPLLLAVNFSVGAYLFMRTKKKNIEEEVTAVTSTPTSAVSTVSVTDPSPAVMEPVKAREPIPLDQQRELFKWILEEKRKVKPKDPQEKKRIDEEKAVLKQFIRAKSVPSL